MKIASWNVNSIRSRIGHVTAWLKAHEPDVLLLQELKGSEFPASSFKELGYESVAVTQKAYNGVAILSRLPQFSQRSREYWLANCGGNATSVTISAEGITILSYFATDNAGNQETAKTLTVRIDKTSPVISGLPARGCTIWPPNHKLVQVAKVTAADALSGLAPGSVKVTGTSNDPEDGKIVITGGPSQFIVQLGADKGQVYTLTATASDLAGNTVTEQATCTVRRDEKERREDRDHGGPDR